MDSSFLRKSNRIEAAFNSQGMEFPEEITIQGYLDLLQRIKEQLSMVNKYFQEVEIGRRSYLPRLRVSSLSLQKLFFLFRAYSCVLYPPRGENSQQTLARKPHQKRHITPPPPPPRKGSKKIVRKQPEKTK